MPKHVPFFRSGVPGMGAKFSSNQEIRYRMNKAELVEAVQKVLGNGASRAETERSLNAVIGAIGNGLKKDRTVQLIGFGTFRVAERAARMGTNPKTREPLKIKKSRTVRFSAGKELKNRI